MELTKQIKDSIICDFIALVNSNSDLTSSVRLFELIKRDLYDCSKNSEEYVKCEKIIIDRMQAWVSALKVDDVIDLYTDKDKLWSEVKILAIDHDARTVRVHFNGWSDKYDDKFSFEAVQMRPHGTIVTLRKKAAAKKKSLEEKVDSTVVSSAVDVSGADEAIVVSSRGRVVKLLGSSSCRETDKVNVKNVNNDGDATKETGVAKKQKVEKDENDWICSICGYLETVDGSDLVLCEGPCRRSFHQTCLANAPPKKIRCKGDADNTTRPSPGLGNDRWLCDDCMDGRHRCFICKKRGKDIISVVKCSAPACGKYYHRSCLEAGVSRGDFLIPKIKTVYYDTTKKLYSNKEPRDKALILPHPSERQVKPLPNSEVKPLPTKIEEENSGVSSADGASNGASMEESRRCSPRKASRPDYRAMHSSKISKSPHSAHNGNTRKQLIDESYSSDEPESDYDVDSYPIIETFAFKCPRHQCVNCFEFYGAVDSVDLERCLYCPRTFHYNCITPGSRYNSMCLICPEHPEAILPAPDAPAPRDSKVILNGSASKKARNEKSLSAVGRYIAFWDQLSIPDIVPDASDVHGNHFKLPTHFREDIKKVPPNYKEIRRNDYEMVRNSIKRSPESPSSLVQCECKGVCGETCLNRVLRIECFGDKVDSQDMDDGEKTVAKQGSKHKMVPGICNVGPHCSNRCLQERKEAKVVVFNEHDMGWGLRAGEAVPKGSLVIEYVGEIIDYDEVHRRMSNQRILTPLDRDFYIMELGDGLYVDGKFKGNRSRFINHSCDPNCELQRWTVKEQMRIGIYAIRDIAPGEAFSYDYQFDTNEADRFKCYCGSENCRGTMAPKEKEKDRYNAFYDENGIFVSNGRSMDKHERKRLINLGKQKKEGVTDERRVAEEWGRSYTGKYLPGDSVNEIRNGPHMSSLKAGQLRRKFLVRNVLRGTNFLKRSDQLRKRIEQYEGGLRPTRSSPRKKKIAMK